LKKQQNNKPIIKDKIDLPVTRVIIPSLSTPFLLSALIKNVQSATSVQEIIELYCGPQTDENSNINIAVIMPILEIRMQDIAEKHLILETEFQITCKRWNDLIKKSNNIQMQLESLCAIINSGDHGSELYKLSFECKTNFGKSNADLKSIFLALNNHEFNIAHLNLHHYLHTHTKLCELVKADEYEFDFVQNQLNNISQELLAYQESISWFELRSKISSALQTFALLGSVSFDANYKKSIHRFINEVLRKKSINALISDELIINVSKLREDLESFLAAFNASINSIYLSEVKQQAVIEAIIVYQTVLKKLFTPHNN
jgi:hypothetical protein